MVYFQINNLLAHQEASQTTLIAFLALTFAPASLIAVSIKFCPLRFPCSCYV